MNGSSWAVDTTSPERIFHTLFAPLYPGDVRTALATARQQDANPGNNPALLASWSDAADTFVRLGPTAFGEDLNLDFSDASVHRLGQALTLDRRAAWLAAAGPDHAPVLAHVVIHGVAYVGTCIVRHHGGLWKLRRPLWESLVGLTSRAGEGDLALFSWWLKALADAEIGRGTFADRYHLHVEVPCMAPEQLPVLVPADRKLPRLRSPRYDTLYKYLRAHVPELRDLGPDFPSPERFAELSFDWLAFVPVGGGRLLLLYGPSSEGVMLVWLNAAGFHRSAFFPADAVPDPTLTIDGDKLRLTHALFGRTVTHEMLWWGP